MKNFLFTLMIGVLLTLPGISKAQQTPSPGPVSIMCGTCTAQISSVTNVASHVALPSSNTALNAITLYNAGTKDLFWLLGDTNATATTSNNLLPAGKAVTVYQNGGAFVSAITGGADTSTLDVLQANGPLTQGFGGGSGGAPSGSAGGDLAGTYPNPTVVSLAHATGFIPSMAVVSAIANFGGL